MLFLTCECVTSVASNTIALYSINKIKKIIDANRELHPSVKQFTRFQINPLIASRLDYFLVSKNFYFRVKECDIVPSLKSDHKIVTLLVHHNSSPRGRGYWKFNNNLLLDDEYITKTKIAIADYLLNNTAIETNLYTRWEALKFFLRGHTINYSCRKKKMSMRQDALENFIKYEETNLLTTNDTQTTIYKISFYQNK